MANELLEKSLSVLKCLSKQTVYIALKKKLIPTDKNILYCKMTVFFNCCLTDLCFSDKKIGKVPLNTERGRTPRKDTSL